MKKLLLAIAVLFAPATVSAQTIQLEPVPTSIYTAGAEAGDYDVSVNDGRLTAPTYVQPAEIDDGFDLTVGGPYLTSTSIAAENSGAGDSVGAFRFLCSPSHSRTDDPVLYPGKVGASHLHQFYGNTLTNAFSTWASLRSTGKGSCINALNRSAYWQPGVKNGKGFLYNPYTIVDYYKQFSPNSGRCTVRVNGTRYNYCLGTIPRGLRVIYGYNPATGLKEGGSPTFVCIPRSGNGRSTVESPYMNVAKAACIAGDDFGIQVKSPPCWDGKNADSPDHRSHMHDATGDGKTSPVCPASHPIILVQITVDSLIRVDDTIATWELSSDFMANGGKGCDADKQGCTLHMDVFPAWKTEIINAAIKNCIQKWKSCNSGDLGDGRIMRPDNTLPLVPAIDKNPMPMATAAGKAHIMHVKQ